MATLTFFLRASSRGNAYPARLSLRITHRRQSKTLSSPYILYLSEWNASRQEVIIHDKNRASYLEDVIQYIKHIRKRFQDTISELSTRVFYTVQEIYNLLYPPKRGKDSLVEFASLLSKELVASGRLRTARAYRSSVNKLLSFTRTRDIRFTDMTPSLVKAFEKELKANGKSLNTISFYMRNLRVIYYRAAEEGLGNNIANPFKGVFTGFYKTPKRALRIDQVQKLQELPYLEYLKQNKKPKEYDEQKLYIAWRYFMFCFHARGMCFVDMVFLRKDNIRKGVIRYYRKKTGSLIEVKITPIMQTLIESFSQETINSPYVFPIISMPGKKERMQYETGLRLQNRRLKELAHKAGIMANLTTHVSRHSWASIAKEENLPLWVISEGLGHSNEKTTYTYLAQLERSRLDMANEMISAIVSCKSDLSVNH